MAPPVALYRDRSAVRTMKSALQGGGGDGEGEGLGSGGGWKGQLTEWRGQVSGEHHEVGSTRGGRWGGEAGMWDTTLQCPRPPTSQRPHPPTPALPKTQTQPQNLTARRGTSTRPHPPPDYQPLNPDHSPKTSPHDGVRQRVHTRPHKRGVPLAPTHQEAASGARGCQVGQPPCQCSVKQGGVGVLVVG